jgi:hypothetical protein
MILIIVEVLIIEVCLLLKLRLKEFLLFNLKVIVVVEITGIIHILIQVVIINGITVEVVVVFVVSLSKEKLRI